MTYSVRIKASAAKTLGRYRTVYEAMDDLPTLVAVRIGHRHGVDC